MSKSKRTIFIAVIYLVAFVGTIFIASAIINRKNIVPTQETAEPSIPVVYIQSGDYLINEMHGYRTAIDSGYLRESITPLTGSSSLDIRIYEAASSVTSLRYELRDVTNTRLIEEGTGTTLEKVQSEKKSRVSFNTGLVEGREYCLTLILSDDSDSEIYYYTRVKLGSELRVSEKINFALDFSEKTFDKDAADDLNQYLESSTDKDNTDFSDVDIHSSFEAVTWGELSPVRVGETDIRIKEINTETASIQLIYEIAVEGEEYTEHYYVTEFYRIRWTSDVVYLLDYVRNVDKKAEEGMFVIEDNMFKLGIVDRDKLDLNIYGTEEHPYVSFVMDGQLWMYDVSDNIMNHVFWFGDEDGNCVCEGYNQHGIKVLKSDDNGDLFFAVYGYMPTGSSEGETGILVYKYTKSDSTIDEIIYIPTAKCYDLLDQDMKTLSVLNDEDIIYIQLDSTIYAIDYKNKSAEIKWDHLDSTSYSISDDNKILAIADQVTDMGISQLNVTNLETGESREISEDGKIIIALGFFEGDLIYGLASMEQVYVNEEGALVTPMDTLRIVDADLNVIKEYTRDGDYIMDVSVDDGIINMTIGQVKQEGDYKSYDVTGTDYIVGNKAAEESDIGLITVVDDKKLNEAYIAIPETDKNTPVSQRARILVPQFNKTVDIEIMPPEKTRYYVYIAGKYTGMYTEAATAIDYASENGGTVLNSNKQVVWQRGEKSLSYFMDLTQLQPVGSSDQIKQGVLETIMSYENIQGSISVGEDTSLYKEMEDNLDLEVVNLTGTDLEDVLYFVYKDCIVVARTGTENYVLLLGYNSNSVTIGNLLDGTVTSVGYSEAENLFSQAGNTFYSYYKK